jgi:hypothetical protein
MTSRREDKEKTSRKETFSSQAGGEKRRETPITRVAKIVEIVGTSNKSWEDAALVAIEEARKKDSGNTWNQNKGYDCKG